MIPSNSPEPYSVSYEAIGVISHSLILQYHVELLDDVSKVERHVVTSKSDLLLMSFFNLQESKSEFN